MLRPLLVLFALTAVPGAVGQTTFSENRELDISSCPITYFGQTYDRVFATFTDTNFVICFNGFYDPATSTDCIIAPKAGPEASFEIFGRSEDLERLIQDELPTIEATLNCYIRFDLGNNISIILANFGAEAVVGLISNVGGITEPNMIFADVSGCRHRGVEYGTGTTTVIPEFCETVQCSDTAVLDVTTCGPTETCLGNNMCVTTTTDTTPPPTISPLPHFICTVAGLTVINFSGHLIFVKDQCEYYLLQIQGLSVVGHFWKRLGDVSFLYSVTLEVNGVHIRLEQGGRVLVDGLSLILGSSLQVVHGVQLSKDQTGVTAIVHIDNFRITIIFDDNTVLIFVEVIHVEVLPGLSLQGLCQTSSSEAELPNCGSTRWLLW